MDDLRSAPVPPVGPDDHVRGPDGAPVVVVYADFTCPRCAVAWSRLRDAPLRIVFRHLALKAKHPRAVALAQAAEAAACQDRFWAFADVLYDAPARTEDPDLWRHCATLGIDIDRFQRDRRDDAAVARVRADVRDALRAGATVTPTLFAGAGGDAYAGAPSPELVVRWAAGQDVPATG